MAKIEQFISPFIEQQFPAFYKSEGPNFVAFVKAYYEWLESNGNILNKSRSLISTADIDQTEEAFIEQFRNTYLTSIPVDIVADKRLLVKHVLDLYRSKGTQRSVELLFRILFNEDIEIYIPGENLLRPSDGKWFQANYIETSFHPNLNKLAGRTITNSQQTSSGVVEYVTKKIIGGETVNLIYMTEVKGSFRRTDRIICPGLITIDDAPIVTGSLTAIPIENGGFNFEVGDIVDVIGRGKEGKARVVRTRDENGKVVFSLISGGSGYTVNAVVTVATTLNISIANSTNTFIENTTALVPNTSANGTIVNVGNNVLTLINFGNTSGYTVGSIITDGTSNATITEIFGGGGTGATFEVGELNNKELILINLDDIQDYTNAVLETQVEIGTGVQTGAFTAGLDIESSANVLILQCTTLSANTVEVGEELSNAALGIANLNVYISDDKLIYTTGPESDLTNANVAVGAILVSNVSSSVIRLDTTPTKEEVLGKAIVFSSNSSAIVANTVNNHMYFVPGATVFDTSNSGLNATITSQTSLTDWFFPSRTPTLLSNLDSRLDETLILLLKEVGTIATLANINPGAGYSSPPYITVIEPEVVKAGIPDGSGGYKGNNAIVIGPVGSQPGVIQAVEVYSSGFGYSPGENVTLVKKDVREGVAASGVTVVETFGVEEGRWLNNKGFISDIIKIQDSDFYQVYSYEIIASRMLNSYRKLVTDLVHPSGYKLFGRFRYTKDLSSNASVISSNINIS